MISLDHGCRNPEQKLQNAHCGEPAHQPGNNLKSPVACFLKLERSCRCKNGGVLVGILTVFYKVILRGGRRRHSHNGITVAAFPGRCGMLRERGKRLRTVGNHAAGHGGAQLIHGVAASRLVGIL